MLGQQSQAVDHTQYGVDSDQAGLSPHNAQHYPQQVAEQKTIDKPRIEISTGQYGAAYQHSTGTPCQPLMGFWLHIRHATDPGIFVCEPAV